MLRLTDFSVLTEGPGVVGSASATRGITIFFREGVRRELMDVWGLNPEWLGRIGFCDLRHGS